MTLIPVSQLPKAKDELESRTGLLTEPIRRRELFKEIRTVGKLDDSERQVAVLTARVAGRVDRVYADFTGIEEKKNDHLVDIYSPDLYAAQAELLRAVEAHQSNAADRRFSLLNLEAARTKLQLLGILPEQIAEIEKTRQEKTHLTIYAPIGGTVIEKNVRVGQYVDVGDEVYRIVDLDPIWLFLNIYEFDIAWIRFGQPVEVSLEAFPGERFSGSIMFIDPFLDDASRTIRVRVNIKNPDRRLKPQMFATATIHVRLRSDGTPAPTGLEGMYVCPMHPEVIQRDPGKCSICGMPLEEVPHTAARSTQDSADKADTAANTSQSPADNEEHPHHGDAAPPPTEAEDGVLAIPVSAVLDTGRRRITYRLNQDGAYELVELELGPRAHATNDSGERREFYVVLDGVGAGDEVVTQMGFLLDSQRQIEGMPSLLYPQGQAGVEIHAGHGGPWSPPSQPEPSSPAHRH